MLNHKVEGSEAESSNTLRLTSESEREKCASWQRNSTTNLTNRLTMVRDRESNPKVREVFIWRMGRRSRLEGVQRLRVKKKRDTCPEKEQKAAVGGSRELQVKNRHNTCPEDEKHEVSGFDELWIEKHKAVSGFDELRENEKHEAVGGFDEIRIMRETRSGEWLRWAPRVAQD